MDQDKIAAFLDDYRALCAKHNRAILYTTCGIVAEDLIDEYETPEERYEAIVESVEALFRGTEEWEER